MKLITFVSAGTFIFFSAFVMKKQNATQIQSLYETKWQLKKIHNAGSVEKIQPGKEKRRWQWWLQCFWKHDIGFR